MKKKSLILVSLLLIVSLMAMGCTGSGNKEPEKQAPAFPQKEVSLIVPFAAGGGTDAVARALANAAEEYLGQPVVVVNKTGGSGAVGMTEGANAKADGYTVTMITREIVSLPLMGLAQISADDFDLLANINQDPAMILVEKDSKYQTIQDLIEDAKANPGQVKLASTAKPNFYVLAIELNQGVKFNQIPYNGAAEAIPATLGGHVEFTVTNPGEAAGQIEAGQLRPLAVMSSERLESFPDVPTMIESGYDVTSGTWRGLAVPKGTPEDVVETLSNAFKQATEDADFVEFMKNAKLEIYYLDAAEYQEFIAQDTELMTGIVEEINNQQ